MPAPCVCARAHAGASWGRHGLPRAPWDSAGLSVEQKLSGSHKALVEMQDVVAELLRTVPQEYPATKVRAVGQVAGREGPVQCGRFVPRGGGRAADPLGTCPPLPWGCRWVFTNHSVLYFKSRTYCLY